MEERRKENGQNQQKLNLKQKRDPRDLLMCDDLNKNFKEISFEESLKDPTYLNRPGLDLNIKKHFHATNEAMRKMAHLCRINPTKPSYINPPNVGPDEEDDDPWIRKIAERTFIDIWS